MRDAILAGVGQADRLLQATPPSVHIILPLKAMLFDPLPLLAACGLLLVVVAYFIYRFAYAPYQVLKRCGIKGPTPVPFFGNFREQKRMTVFKYYEYLQQEYGPVVGFYIGKKPHILITDLDMVKQIMVKDFKNFMDREGSIVGILPNGSKGLLFSRGETWKTTRQLLSPTFSTSKMKMMVPLIMRSIDLLVEVFGERVKTGESFNVLKIYESFTMEIILATAFGRIIDIQRGESDELTKVANDQFRQMQEGQLTSREGLVMLLNNFQPMTPIFKFLYAHSKQGEIFNRLYRIALELVKARRRSETKHKDMLQLMIDATGEEEEEQAEEDTNGEDNGDNTNMTSCPFHKNKEALTDEEVVMNVIVILMAAYETTANTLAYTSYLLAINPDIQEKLQSEIDSYFDDKPDASAYEASQKITYLDNIIQESLRLYSPVPRTNRACLKTTIIKGVTIPQGSCIIIPNFLLHRNPLYWKDPDKFNPDRFTPEERARRPQLAHIPFGFGPRSCIGMRFALLEAKMALIEMLKRCTFVRAPDTEVPLRTVLGITMVPKHGIYLKVVNHT